MDIYKVYNTFRNFKIHKLNLENTFINDYIDKLLEQSGKIISLWQKINLHRATELQIGGSIKHKIDEILFGDQRTPYQQSQLKFFLENHISIPNPSGHSTDEILYRNQPLNEFLDSISVLPYSTEKISPYESFLPFLSLYIPDVGNKTIRIFTSNVVKDASKARWQVMGVLASPLQTYDTGDGSPSSPTLLLFVIKNGNVVGIFGGEKIFERISDYLFKLFSYTETPNEGVLLRNIGLTLSYIGTSIAIYFSNDNHLYINITCSIPLHGGIRHTSPNIQIDSNIRTGFPIKLWQDAFSYGNHKLYHYTNEYPPVNSNWDERVIDNFSLYAVEIGDFVYYFPTLGLMTEVSTHGIIKDPNSSMSIHQNDVTNGVINNIFKYIGVIGRSKLQRQDQGNTYFAEKIISTIGRDYSTSHEEEDWGKLFHVDPQNYPIKTLPFIRFPDTRFVALWDAGPIKTTAGFKVDFTTTTTSPSSVIQEYQLNLTPPTAEQGSEARTAAEYGSFHVSLLPGILHINEMYKFNTNEGRVYYEGDGYIALSNYGLDQDGPVFFVNLAEENWGLPPFNPTKYYLSKLLVYYPPVTRRIPFKTLRLFGSFISEISDTRAFPYIPVNSIGLPEGNILIISLVHVAENIPTQLGTIQKGLNLSFFVFNNTASEPFQIVNSAKLGKSDSEIQSQIIWENIEPLVSDMRVYDAFIENLVIEDYIVENITHYQISISANIIITGIDFSGNAKTKIIPFYASFDLQKNSYNVVTPTLTNFSLENPTTLNEAMIDTGFIPVPIDPNRYPDPAIGNNELGDLIVPLPTYPWSEIITGDLSGYLLKHPYKILQLPYHLVSWGDMENLLYRISPDKLVIRKAFEYTGPISLGIMPGGDKFIKIE